MLRRALHSSLQVRLPNDAPRKGGLSLLDFGSAQRWSLTLVVLQVASGLLPNNSNTARTVKLSDYAATYAFVDALKIAICAILMTRERSGLNGSNGLQLPTTNPAYTPLPRHRSPVRRSRSRSHSRQRSLPGPDKHQRTSSIDNGEIPRGRRGSIQGSGLGRRSFSNSNGASNRPHEYPPDSNRRGSLSELPEEVILDDDFDPPEQTQPGLGRQHALQLISLACLLLMADYSSIPRATMWNKVPMHIAAALTIVFAGLNDRIFVGRPAVLALWTPALLQFCASILPSPILPSTFSDLSIFMATPASTSLLLLAVELLFKINHAASLFTLALIVFSITFPVHVGAFFLSSAPLSISWSMSFLVHGLLQAGIGVASIAVIKYSSVFAFCSLTLLSSAILLPVHNEILQALPDQQAIQLFIAAMGVYGAFAFWRAWTTSDSPPNSPPGDSESRWWRPKAPAILWSTCLAVLLIAGQLSAFNDEAEGERTWTIDPLSLRDAMFVPSPPNSLTFSTKGGLDGQCVRPPLPPSSSWNGTRKFDRFDDVLLVVFFSHARYDVNLDAHREAYAPYFPNILYIGPASREDKGFNHSYDVFVDSYQSEEDLTGWYKMAGRMAHHMFYTAVKDNPCYSGYLWAPFDAFLNIARLAQFPQDRIWYHSPFGEYIPNPAMSSFRAVDKHPPPAMVSTDTPKGYAEKFVPFGQDGWAWWWGEPHVGLEVCWPGYEKVRKEFRDRLQSLTGQPDRFIGGSADTLYIPGQLRDEMLETLGYFLETDCFLEIALPTTLHLILPPKQKIAYVDHWWIWMPPLNTTFVRNKWEEGMEVDSFHTFHWGDKDADGVWRPHLNSVNDVAQVQADSFKRQGMTVAYV